MNCLFYYSTEVPKIEATMLLENHLVVMQDYHPLCSQGLLAEFFPLCSRHLYLNCSYIHLNEIGQYDINVFGLVYNPQWQTYKLNLKDPKVFNFILQKALKLLSIEGVDGLFLDDIDPWSGDAELRDIFERLIQEICLQSKKKVEFSLNRGECFWHRIPNLKAIVLENVTPAWAFTAENFDLRWLENLVKINFGLLKAKNIDVPVFGLRYKGSEEDVTRDYDFDLDEKRESLYRDLKNNIKNVLICDKDFSTWPQHLQ